MPAGAVRGWASGMDIYLRLAIQLLLDVPDVNLIFPERTIPGSGLRGCHPCIRCWRQERSPDGICRALILRLPPGAGLSA